MASDERFQRQRLAPTGPMYIAEFLLHVKERNYASWVAVMALVQIVRSHGVHLAKADLLGTDTCLARTHVGYGLLAEIEFDRNRAGKWQPVIGRIVAP